MAKDAARVARIVNETVAEGRNTLVALFKVMKDVLGNIHFISLENNELKSITGDFMTNFNQLRELNLEGNYLKKLPDEVKTLTHLKTINLARNKLSTFPHQLTELTTLENINLEANEITGQQQSELHRITSNFHTWISVAATVIVSHPSIEKTSRLVSLSLLSLSPSSSAFFNNVITSFIFY
ncbi:leucine-rich repeat-containing protein 20 isoform X1 [Pristis pectinata]|uniref:leucine-rich repeat-containing protein 20 isoform X1 n=1 Tax=Pristis pectinata TaxID=685728 RepID=UPI00223CB876|nr:leucine-rich repeat-containing protein 20 isoform X1 [Pristis pectinata]